MSKIEWTGKTWNPVVGCDKVSEGCKNCYAIRMAYRLMNNPNTAVKYEGTAIRTPGGALNWTGRVNVLQSEFGKPLDNKKPTVYFVNSMSDLFHEIIPFEIIDSIFDTMDAANWHSFQVLTKRPKRMVEFFNWKAAGNGFKFTEWPLKNVWVGVSVEHQKAADERIPLLLQVPAAVRFLSCEPLLGEVDLTKYLLSLEFEGIKACTGVNWVICGGESGYGARPMHPDWARSLRDQCKAAAVPFFFKQWGEWKPVKEHINEAQYTGGSGDIHFDNPVSFDKVGKKKAGRCLDGQLYDEMPK